MNKSQFSLLIIIAAAIVSYFALDLGRFLTLEFIQSQLETFEAYKDENFALVAFIYLVVYVALTAWPLPVALILTLLGGALFGVFWGTILVSFASSFGATLPNSTNDSF